MIINHLLRMGKISAPQSWSQNNRLSGQNAALAGSSSTYSRQKESLDAQVSALQERNHSLNDQRCV